MKATQLLTFNRAMSENSLTPKIKLKNKNRKTKHVLLLL